MIISYKYKFIFIKTRKTAGTSIEVFLSKHCGDDDIIAPIGPPESGHIPRNYKGNFNVIKEMFAQPPSEATRTIKDFLKRKRFYNHIPAFRVRARLPKKVWDNFFKFCIERNPWEKTLSRYYRLYYKSNGKLSFDEYMSRGDFPVNYPLYTDGHKHERVIVDQVVKYESLSKGLKQIFKQLGVPFKNSLEIYAKSYSQPEKRPYQEIFSDKHRKIVETFFKKELLMHDYKFD